MSLVLLPNLLGRVASPTDWFIPKVVEEVARLDGLIAESEREGRRFLGYFATKRPAREMVIAPIPKRASSKDWDFLLEPVIQGETWGVVTDAGLPCLADPGAQLVRRARRAGVAVRAYPGPCALTHALMLSGLSSQSFAFVGYLQREREKHLQHLEKRSAKGGALQLFIEAPYRNVPTLETAIHTLDEETTLGVGWDLTLPDEQVISQKVARWRTQKLPDIAKRPAIFWLAGRSTRY